MSKQSDCHTEPAIVPATKKRADIALATALRQFGLPPNSESECQQPATNAIIEACAWIAAACIVWAVAALCL
jgi:hypothetical protein